MPEAGTGSLVGPVEVVGTGLVGTSVALACARAGIEVLLSDHNDEHVRTASGLGAGRVRRADDRPQLVVVAVPPDVLGPVITAALTASEAVVTDVGSIKARPLAQVLEHPEAAAHAARYVGSHPMAGSEHSGPLAASPTLFEGRPWAITPHRDADVAAVELVEDLVRLVGAVPAWLTPEEHDRAVARISHVPHLVSSLVAGRLAGAPDNHLSLSGQGVRDVTRVAAGDPRLYGQIVAGNAPAVGELLRELRRDLDAMIEAIAGDERAALEQLLETGVAGTRAIPGKHGAPATAMVSVFVTVPDHPGELARLLADAVASEVNVEDIRIDHDTSRPTGLVELVVAEQSGERLLVSLESRGWVTHR
ncbi:prephenate dehydrogenase [Nocardioides sp. OK12]|uniref:Prephenate dehydrogenase n=1 Tax=Nocardioides marinisabuli TaxID=419476 RepID=A0A7Y9F5B9_9ACTN|nr:MULTISPECIES: prephenate dehydrogenase [Nocardioides]NYD58925.1 prephenate dehydrogenase [Nocardioides marinisabuli]GHJ61283.1 prephenate dehydrogenase [Nocardioides sp. OK12]